MPKPVIMLFTVISVLAIAVCAGCGPKEEGAKEVKKEVVAQPPLKNPNELERWNGVDLFYKNTWVDAAVQVVDDNEADKGKALVYKGANGLPKMAEYMNRGPYTELQPGKYIIVYRLKVSDVNFDTDKPVYIDVEVSDKGKRVFLGSRVLTGKDFVKDQWNDHFTLDVDIKEPGVAEMRVKPTVAADTYLDYIAIIKK